MIEYPRCSNDLSNFLNDCEIKSYKSDLRTECWEPLPCCSPTIFLRRRRVDSHLRLSYAWQQFTLEMLSKAWAWRSIWEASCGCGEFQYSPDGDLPRCNALCKDIPAQSTIVWSDKVCIQISVWYQMVENRCQQPVPDAISRERGCICHWRVHIP